MSIHNNIIIGITGASGAIYALRTIMNIPPDFTIYLVFSDIAKKVMKMETGWDGNHKSLTGFLTEHFNYKKQLARIKQYKDEDHFAPIASGSFKVRGMVIVPASAKTISEIANGYATNLIGRAADVMLKERQKLIVVARETPLNRVHLENMLKITDAGGIILPAMPAFYHKPQTILDLVDFVVGRVLNLLEIPHNLFKPWGP